HGLVLGVLLLARPRPAGVWDVVWCAAVWTCWEAVRTLVFPYYPAAVLALSQHAMRAVLRVASLCGVGGVNVVLAAFNVGVASLLRTSSGTRRILAALTGIAIALGAFGWGMVRLSIRRPAPRGLQVVAVDVDAADQTASTLDRYLAASEDPAT